MPLRSPFGRSLVRLFVLRSFSLRSERDITIAENGVVGGEIFSELSDRFPVFPALMGNGQTSSF